MGGGGVIMLKLANTLLNRQTNSKIDNKLAITEKNQHFFVIQDYARSLGTWGGLMMSKLANTPQNRQIVGLY